MALVAYDSSDDSLHSEHGEDQNCRDCQIALSPKANDGIRTCPADQKDLELKGAVKSGANGKPRKSVQILLPSLCQAESDSDDDNCSIKPDLKRFKSAAVAEKCGLFAVLPPPTAATQLTPHQLMKSTPKEQPLKKLPPVSAAKMQLVAGSTGNANTISGDNLYKNVESSVALSATNKLQASLSPSCSVDSVEDHDKSSNFFAFRTDLVHQNSLTEDFNCTSNELAHGRDVCNTELLSLEDGRCLNVNAYNMDTKQHNLDVLVKADDHGEPSMKSNLEEYLQDEQFLRMCGRKHNYKQAVNIIDIHADDQLRDVDLTKSLSEEVSVAVSHSKKHNKDLPSSQQKRKHQLTYLAYKAKERELELKNQWAENKFNKRQTQSKYGF